MRKLCIVLVSCILVGCGNPGEIRETYASKPYSVEAVVTNVSGNVVTVAVTVNGNDYEYCCYATGNVRGEHVIAEFQIIDGKLHLINLK